MMIHFGFADAVTLLDSHMANDAKLGLLSGLAAVILVAVIYYQRNDNFKVKQIDSGKPQLKSSRGVNSLNPGVDSDAEDPVIHPQKKPQQPKPDVFVRPETVE